MPINTRSKRNAQSQNTTSNEDTTPSTISLVVPSDEFSVVVPNNTNSKSCITIEKRNKSNQRSQFIVNELETNLNRQLLTSADITCSTPAVFHSSSSISRATNQSSLVSASSEINAAQSEPTPSIATTEEILNFMIDQSSIGNLIIKY